MISVCIPSRGNVIGLWATICACEVSIEGANADREYIVCLNGTDFDEPHSLLRENSRGMVRFLHSADPLPPPMARNFAAEAAKGRVLFFFDDHCVPSRYLFRRALGLDKDVLHFCYSTHVGYHSYYHYLPNDGNPLHGDYTRIPQSSQPYRCMSGPHGGFAVKRTVWNELNGYDDFWQGFGGEEAYFDIKASLKGYEVWLDPGSHFYHFSCRPSVRGYDKTFNEWNFEEGLRRLERMGFINLPSFPVVK